MRTLVGAAEPDGADPARGFVADYSLTNPDHWTWVWADGQTGGQVRVPWLSEVREPTISLTHPVTTTPVASGYATPIKFNFPPKET